MLRTDQPAADELLPRPMAGGRFARNSAYGTLAGVSRTLVAFLSTVVIAHLLGVRETGVVTFALWAVSLTATIADLGAEASLARYLPELTARGRSQEARGLIGLLLRPVAAAAFAVLIGFVGYAAWRWRVADRGEAEPLLWLLVGAACALQTLSAFTYGCLRGLQRFEAIAALTILSAALQLACVAAGSLFFGVAGALAGYCAGIVVPAGLCWALVHRGVRLPRELKTRVARYALYAWAGGLSASFVWSRIEVFFLQRSAGSAAVGLFMVALTLANLAGQGPVLLTAGMLPYFAERFGAQAFGEMREAYATATRVLALLVLPACFGLAAVMPVALPLIYGHAFAAAVPAAMVLVAAAAFGSVSSVGASLVYAVDRSDFVFAVGAVAAVLAVAAGFTVIPAFGLLGAAWARAGIQLFCVVAGGCLLAFRLGFPMPLKDLARLTGAAGVCALAARGVLQLTSGPVALVGAIPLGAVTYLAALRALGGLPHSDIRRLRSLARRLPAGMHPVSELALRLLWRGTPVRPAADLPPSGGAAHEN